MGKGQLGIASDEDLVGNVWQYGKLLEVRLPSFIVFLSLFCVHYYICLENKFVIILDFGDNSQIRKRQSSLAIAW